LKRGEAENGASDRKGSRKKLINGGRGGVVHAKRLHVAEKPGRGVDFSAKAKGSSSKTSALVGREK